MQGTPNSIAERLAARDARVRARERAKKRQSFSFFENNRQSSVGIAEGSLTPAEKQAVEVCEDFAGTPSPLLHKKYYSLFIDYFSNTDGNTHLVLYI